MPQLLRVGLPDLVPMERSQGRHVSHAIRRACIQLGHLDDTEMPEDKTRMEFGSAFEDFVAARVAVRWPDRYIFVGEQCHEDIYGTLDLFDTQESAVVEIKWTALSTNNDPEGLKFWKYWKQIQAYCVMMGVNKGQLWVCHNNGDYKYGKGGPCQWCGQLVDGPHLHVWQQEFSDSELADTWALVKAYA